MNRILMKRIRLLMTAFFVLSFLPACVEVDEEENDTLENATPIANAGSDSEVDVDSIVTLSAAQSEDADGDSLSYQWQLLSLPNNSAAILSHDSSVEITFVADIAGDYTISLVVNDGTVDSEAVSVIISAVTTETGSTVTEPAASLSYAIVDTNQTSCYNSDSGDTQACSGTGMDADYAGHQPSYSVNDVGTVVTDNVTGLVWQQSSDLNDDGELNYDDKLFQSEALTYCEELVLDGREDWRLPSLKEAYSLILFSGKDASDYQGTDTSTLTPFLSEEFDWAFGDLDSGVDRIIDAQYASTNISVTPLMTGTTSMFGVNYVDGRIKGYPLNRKEFYVRCVTGTEEYGVNDFVDNQDTTITDNATGLMWQKNDSDSSDWDDALNICGSADTANHDDWRLPNVKELQSIVDYDVSPDTDQQAAINNIFNSTAFTNEEGIEDWGFYWASTTHVSNGGDGSNATYVSFGRALGYMNDAILDVHGAGAQRSNDKVNLATEPAASVITTDTSSFYIKGPQGDILRLDNKVRCVRDAEGSEDNEEATTVAYTFFAPMGSKETLLINQQGEEVHTWNSNFRPALSAYLLENGELLRTGATNSKPSTFTSAVGGAGGVIEVLDWDSSVLWSTELATDEHFSHHDVEVLPNGNILAIVWEAKAAEEAYALGRGNVNGDTLWADAVYEICRASSENSCSDGEVVWRWSIWDHVVQDQDASITGTYVSDVSDYPNKVDLNYWATPASDWNHTNSIDYNSETQEILLSVRNFSEYWVISHTDNTQGIVRRFGNPAAYGGDGEQVLFSQHDASWIDADSPGAGNILVFNNGEGRSDGDYSSVDEFCDTENCTIGEMVSSYSQGADGDFYSDHISGAERLSNGNTLICEGVKGHIFEIDDSNELVWEYTHDSELFRASRYNSDYAGLAELVSP